MNEPFEKSEAGPAVMEVDRLLREFYRAEMPNPWPRRRVPRSTPARASAPRFARIFRCAVAASLVVAFLSYWAVAGLFPEQGAGGNRIVGPEIGEKMPHRAPQKHLAPIERQRTPAGNDAQLFEEGTSGGKAVITVIGPSQSKGMR